MTLLQLWGPQEIFTVAEELFGFISDIKIRHDSTEDSPPVAGIHVGDKFLVKVTGENVSDVYIQMGLLYRVYKPDGTILEYTAWEAGATAPGYPHTFIQGPAGIDTSFVVDQEGVWSLYLELLGRPA